MIENDWEIAGEVICKYSDDDFECGINEEIAEARYETNSDCFLLWFSSTIKYKILNE